MKLRPVATNELTLEYLSLDELKPNARNTRAHGVRQVRQLAKAIETFGFGVPMLVDADNGILAGHGRLAACQLLGIARVPVVRLSHLTPAQALAFQIAENRLTELGGWN